MFLHIRPVALDNTILHLIAVRQGRRSCLLHTFHDWSHFQKSLLTFDSWSY